MGLFGDVYMLAKEIRDKRGMDRTVQIFRMHKGDELYWQWLLEFISQAQHWGLKKDECLMAGQKRGFEMAAKNEQKFLECLDRIEREVGIDKDELECRINKALGRKAVLDTEKLGFKLAEAIDNMLDESADDIQSTLGERSKMIAFEYTALLLWIIAKEASIVLPEKAISPTIGTTLGVIFSYFKNSEVNVFGNLGDDGLNLQAFEGYVRNRFDLYDWAWNVYSRMKDDRCSNEEVEALSQVSEVTVAMNFIVRCFADEAEYHGIFSNPKERMAHTVCVLNHYRRFKEKIKRVLSSY